MTLSRRRRRQPDAAARLEARTVTVHLTLGAGASVQADAVPLPDVADMVRWSVALRRALIAEGLVELVPHDVSHVGADRVEVPEEGGEEYPPEFQAPPRVGFR